MRVIAGPSVVVNAARGGRGGRMPITIPLIMGFSAHLHNTAWRQHHIHLRYPPLPIYKR